MTGTQGRIQDLIRGGAQIMTGLKLPFWGLSFVEFWCWGLIFGGQGGPGAPPDPPLGTRAPGRNSGSRTREIPVHEAKVKCVQHSVQSCDSRATRGIDHK